MTTHQANELAALKVHEAAFAKAVADAEARGNAHFTTLGMDRHNLANIRAKIAEIERASTSNPTADLLVPPPKTGE